MPITYSPALRTARLQEVLAAVDAGAPASVLRIRTSVPATLVDIPLANPSGVVSGDTYTLTVPVEAAATGTGTAASAQILDGDGVVVVDGLTVGVTGSGADIILDALAVTTGITVRLVSAVVTHPS